MDIAHNCEYLIEIIENAIIIKEKEKEQVIAYEMDKLTQNVKLAQIQSGIDELMMQRTYYSDYLRNWLLNNCSGETCARCCRFKQNF